MKAPRRKPTFKQAQFAKKYIEYKGNGAKAALQVYDTTPRNAKNVAYIEMQKPAVKKEITKLLDENGLDLRTLTGLTNNAVTKNLENGKASQAVGADLLKFLFKLHNVMPATKTMRLSLSKSEQLPSKDMMEIKILLSKMNENTTKILKDLEK